MRFFVLGASKPNIFGFGTVGWTEANYLKTSPRALGNCEGHFPLFSDVL